MYDSLGKTGLARRRPVLSTLRSRTLASGAAQAGPERTQPPACPPGYPAPAAADSPPLAATPTATRYVDAADRVAAPTAVPPLPTDGLGFGGALRRDSRRGQAP